MNLKSRILQFSICCFITAILFGCENNTAGSQPSKVGHATLIVSNAGNIYNFNLDENKVSWEYTSKFDTSGNRNYFALDGQQIFLPFESGQFISFDVNTGNINWQRQVYGEEDGIMDMIVNEDGEAAMYSKLKPLFMTKPLVHGENVLINSAGKPDESMGYLYNFDKVSGNKTWFSKLPTVFNYYAPVHYKENYFVNSAVYLEKYSPKSGTWTSYGMFDGDVEVAGEPLPNNPPNRFLRPIYCQMQANKESLFIGDEKGHFYCLKLDKNAQLHDGDLSDPNNTFINSPQIFKWTFHDKEYSFQKNEITFLTRDALFVELQTGLSEKSCIYALNPDNGEVKWKKSFPEVLKTGHCRTVKLLEIRISIYSGWMQMEKTILNTKLTGNHFQI